MAFKLFFFAALVAVASAGNLGLGYAGTYGNGLGYSGLGYSGLGYSGLGLSGLGYSGLGLGSVAHTGLGYSAPLVARSPAVAYSAPITRTIGHVAPTPYIHQAYGAPALGRTTGFAPLAPGLRTATPYW